MSSASDCKTSKYGEIEREILRKVGATKFNFKQQIVNYFLCAQMHVLHVGLPWQAGFPFNYDKFYFQYFAKHAKSLFVKERKNWHAKETLSMKNVSKLAKFPGICHYVRPPQKMELVYSFT